MHERRYTECAKNGFELYVETGSVTKTALRCGITRSTLYRWINCEKEQGKSELSDKSKRSSRLANMKITPEIETIILNLCVRQEDGERNGLPTICLEENKALRHDGVACVEKHQVKAVVKRCEKFISSSSRFFPIGNIRITIYPPPLFIAAGKTCLTAIRDARHSNPYSNVKLTAERCRHGRPRGSPSDNTTLVGDCRMSTTTSTIPY